MDITYIEHLIAPRLEKDVHDYFTQVRFGASVPRIKNLDHSKNQQQEWLEVFFDYFADWNFLIYSQREYELSFWIHIFRDAYFYVLSQLNPNLRYFLPDMTHTPKWMIEQILEKLKILFKTTGFNEYLNHYNDQYVKRINHIRESYIQVSKFSVDAPDLKFYLSFLPETERLYSINWVIRAFRAFEKKLKNQTWFSGHVIFTYYHLIRDSYRNCYVIRFYLTFQKVFYSTYTNYSALIQQLWQEVTEGFGTLLSVDDEKSNQPFGNPFGLDSDQVLLFSEPQNPLDDLDHLPEVATGISENMNKICIVPTGFKVFHGKKW